MLWAVVAAAAVFLLATQKGSGGTIRRGRILNAAWDAVLTESIDARTRVAVEGSDLPQFRALPPDQQINAIAARVGAEVYPDEAWPPAASDPPAKLTVWEKLRDVAALHLGFVESVPTVDVENGGMPDR